MNKQKEILELRKLFLKAFNKVIKAIEENNLGEI